MIDLYGTANGFGWKLNDVIGAQIVSVPMQVALERANEVFMVYLGWPGRRVRGDHRAAEPGAALRHRRPIRRMSAIASEVSLGNIDAPEFAESGRDEIASLAQSFNRMRRSLANAMKMLETLRSPTPPALPPRSAATASSADWAAAPWG